MAPRKNEGLNDNSGRAIWSHESLLLFIDVCTELVERSMGKSGTIVSQKIPWNKVEFEFRKRSQLCYSKAQLKNKYDYIRGRYSLWKQLKGKETGLGWDHEKRTIAASEEWWDKKIQENPNFKTFQEEGVEPEFESKMEQLVGISVATGFQKFTPGMTSPSLDEDYGQEEEYVSEIPTPTYGSDHNASSSCTSYNVATGEWEQLWKDSSPSPTSQAATSEMMRGRKRSREFESDEFPCHGNTKNKSKKQSGAALLAEKLGGIMMSIEERNKSMKALIDVDAPKYSIADALVKLVNLPNLPHNSPLFSYACTMIEDAQKRIVLFELPSDEARVNWIKFCYDERKRD